MRNAEREMAECKETGRKEWTSSLSPQDPCLVLSLPDSAADLAGAVPAPMLKNLRYCQRRARGAGDVRFECATPANFEELFEALLRLHGARWGGRGQAGVLADGAIASFHRQAAAAMLAAGTLRLYALRFNHHIIACHYGFQHGGRAYYYLGGFDPAFAQFSPGTLIVAHAIDSARQEGAREFNFLRGREPYKYRWGARDRPTYQLQLIK
jgi:CelD/BcsL family acetyltransferase involved in cellulose biosynthesis